MVYDKTFGLTHMLKSETRNISMDDWYANNGERLKHPNIKVPPLFMIVSNMTKPYGPEGKVYGSATKLHAAAMEKVGEESKTYLAQYGQDVNPHHLHVWHMQRLGHLCDYNGIDILGLAAGRAYDMPDEEK